MRKMQRFAALGLAGTMALSLAACGGSSASTTDSTPASTASSTEATAESTASGDSVTLNWALWDKDSTAYWAALADGYMASHPGVTIEMTDLGSTDYMTQLATQLAGGNACIPQGILHGSHCAGQQVAGHHLELGAGDGQIKVVGAVLAHSDEGQIELGREGAGQLFLGLFGLFF